uniref:Intraflagellar transport protein 46 homolog n=1 Tax=Phlebotomus papatasi TaxID=29031 RepID=A0A1B0D8W9_PHLPP
MDMYDEEVEVKNGREVETPPNLDVSNAIHFIQSDLQKLSDGEESLEFPLSKMDEKKLGNGSVQKFQRPGSESSGGSDSASEDLNKRFAEGDFNPKDYEHLEVPSDIKEMFQYILRYTPQKIDIEYRLQPFIPDYIPAVGDIDAFLKVLPPKSLTGRDDITPFIDSLGLTILDEPCGQQSEPALLHMKLRSVSTVPHVQDHPPAILKSPKDINRWIAEIQALHSNQPQQTLLYYEKNPINIDSLMAEWPPVLEKTFNELGFPSVDLDCSLLEYINIVCSLLDIPLKGKTQADYIYVLHTLFSLFAAVKRP